MFGSCFNWFKNCSGSHRSEVIETKDGVGSIPSSTQVVAQTALELGVKPDFDKYRILPMSRHEQNKDGEQNKDKALPNKAPLRIVRISTAGLLKEIPEGIKKVSLRIKNFSTRGHFRNERYPCPPCFNPPPKVAVPGGMTRSFSEPNLLLKEHSLCKHFESQDPFQAIKSRFRNNPCLIPLLPLKQEPNLEEKTTEDFKKAFEKEADNPEKQGDLLAEYLKNLGNPNVYIRSNNLNDPNNSDFKKEVSLLQYCLKKMDSNFESQIAYYNMVCNLLHYGVSLVDKKEENKFDIIKFFNEIIAGKKETPQISTLKEIPQISTLKEASIDKSKVLIQFLKNYVKEQYDLKKNKKCMLNQLLNVKQKGAFSTQICFFRHIILSHITTHINKFFPNTKHQSQIKQSLDQSLKMQYFFNNFFYPHNDKEELVPRYNPEEQCEMWKKNFQCQFLHISDAGSRTHSVDLVLFNNNNLNEKIWLFVCNRGLGSVKHNIYAPYLIQKDQLQKVMYDLALEKASKKDDIDAFYEILNKYKYTEDKKFIGEQHLYGLICSTLNKIKCEQQKSNNCARASLFAALKLIFTIYNQGITEFKMLKPDLIEVLDEDLSLHEQKKIKNYKKIKQEKKEIKKYLETYLSEVKCALRNLYDLEIKAPLFSNLEFYGQMSRITKKMSSLLKKIKEKK